MIGFAFFRDTNTPENPPEGMKRVMFTGVCFVPNSFNAEEAIYEMKPNANAWAYSLFDPSSKPVAEFGFLKSTGKRFLGHALGQIITSDWLCHLQETLEDDN